MTRSSRHTATCRGWPGSFCEPASAASVAGIRKMAAAGKLDPDATVVAVLTGHGLKDPHTAERQVPGVIESAPDPRGGRRRTRLDVGGNVVAHWLAELDGRRVIVEAPASSANLGAGYDCLGVALALTNRVELEVRGWSRGEIELSVEGEGRNELSEDHDNRFVRGLEAALEVARGPLPDGVGWRIGMRNQIPLARGLGSSAAATVAGVVAANALLGGRTGHGGPAPRGDERRGPSRQRGGGPARWLRRERHDPRWRGGRAVRRAA